MRSTTCAMVTPSDFSTSLFPSRQHPRSGSRISHTVTTGIVRRSCWSEDRSPQYFDSEKFPASQAHLNDYHRWLMMCALFRTGNRGSWALHRGTSDWHRASLKVTPVRARSAAIRREGTNVDAELLVDDLTGRVDIDGGWIAAGRIGDVYLVGIGVFFDGGEQSCDGEKVSV